MKKILKAQVFRSGAFETWEKFSERVAEWASQFDDGRLVNISHSDAQGGLMIVWYWSM